MFGPNFLVTVRACDFTTCVIDCLILIVLNNRKETLKSIEKPKSLLLQGLRLCVYGWGVQGGWIFLSDCIESRSDCTFCAICFGSITSRDGPMAQKGVIKFIYIISNYVLLLNSMLSSTFENIAEKEPVGYQLVLLF